MSRRPERVAALVRETIAEYLRAVAKDPRVEGVTITGVDVSRDLALAVVRISTIDDAMGRAGATDRALDGLASARGHLRSYLGRVLRLKQVPELRFEADRGLDHAQRIDAILAELRRKGEAD